MKNQICSECKKEYKTYPVIFTNKIESLAMEFEIRDLYYDEEENIGLCEECRKKVWEDKVWVWRLWLGVRLTIMLIQSKYEKEGNTKKVKEMDNALKRIDEKDKELEKLPEVKKILEKNKKSLKDGNYY